MMQVVADEQKRRFASNPVNKGKWIDRGLWRLSRHPNFLGEITLWLGAYLVALSSLEGGELNGGHLEVSCKPYSSSVCMGSLQDGIGYHS